MHHSVSANYTKAQYTIAILLSECLLVRNGVHRYFSCLAHFYRTMYYSAKRGLATACGPSVCLSVTLVDQKYCYKYCYNSVLVMPYTCPLIWLNLMSEHKKNN